MCETGPGEDGGRALTLLIVSREEGPVRSFQVPVKHISSTVQVKGYTKKKGTL